MAATSAKSQKSAFIHGTGAAGDLLNGVFTISNFVIRTANWSHKAF